MTVSLLTLVQQVFLHVVLGVLVVPAAFDGRHLRHVAAVPYGRRHPRGRQLPATGLHAHRPQEVLGQQVLG